ncbi:hypothetical protein B0H14DRAFT_2596318 [Mycena olivaceomarginata]|nr:hypothetical protein B0H14DRAFT_2596318 [Mycena olivaceomarginata]
MCQLYLDSLNHFLNSAYSITHTKHNHLNLQKVHKFTVVHMDCMESHHAAGLVPQRWAWHFSSADDQVAMAAMDTDSASPALDGGHSVGPSAANANNIDFGIVTDLLINLAVGEDAEDAAAATDTSIDTILQLLSYTALRPPVVRGVTMGHSCMGIGLHVTPYNYLCPVGVKLVHVAINLLLGGTYKIDIRTKRVYDVLSLSSHL